MKIWGFDPGGTTGWACCDLNPAQGIERFWHGMLGPDDHHGELWHFLNDHVDHLDEDDRRDIIVCESFEYRNGLPKAELMSVEYIGIVKLFEQWNLTIPVIWQTASMGKIRNDQSNKKGSFVQQRHLERLGLWSSKETHAMDAYGHIIYAVINGDLMKVAPELREKLLLNGWRP